MCAVFGCHKWEIYSCPLHQQRNSRYLIQIAGILVAGARNHRNLPVEILALFSQEILQPFDAAA